MPVWLASVLGSRVSQHAGAACLVLAADACPCGLHRWLVRVPWARRYAFSITSQTPVECLASSAGSMQCSMLAHQCDRCAGAMATEVCFQHCLRHRLSVWPAPLAACSVACCTLAWQMCGCHGHRCMHSALPHRHPLSVWPAPLAACSVACLHISVTDVRVPWAPRYAFSITSQTPVECLAGSAGSMQV